ncbi:uncharacterized protein LOC142329209 [Lycorma delicatula]|uniref:uncharacterized protein LOC142329209 n=1 Tax=Lycorma delicatula TaxID=130591 RepID=UPI003F5121A1
MDACWEIAVRRGCEIILLSEPDRRTIVDDRWVVSADSSAAILVSCGTAAVHNKGAGPGYVWVELARMVMFSVYLSPNSDFLVYARMVDDLVEEIARWRSKIVVVSGDFNVKVRSWGSAIDDRRGRLLEDAMASVDLQCVNRRGEMTFESGGVGIFVPDLTFVNMRGLQRLLGWQVLGEETLSDHRLITFEIGDVIQEERPGTRSVRFHSGSVAQFRAAIDFELGCSKDTDLNELTDTVFRVGAETGVIKEVTAGRAGVNWWTPELAKLRRRCVMSRHCLKRTQRPGENIEEELGRLRLARRDFRGATASKKCKRQ